MLSILLLSALSLAGAGLVYDILDDDNSSKNDRGDIGGETTDPGDGNDDAASDGNDILDFVFQDNEFIPLTVDALGGDDLISITGGVAAALTAAPV